MKYITACCVLLLTAHAVSSAPIWERVLIPENYTFARAWSVATDASGNVYATGEAIYGAKNPNILTAKYNSDGELQWVAVYDSLQIEGSRAVETDADGNIYVAGTTGSGDGTNILLLKYNPDGNLLWSRAYNGPAGKRDTAAQMIIIGSRAIILGGSLQSSGISPSKWVAVSYTGNGEIEWVREFDNNGATQLNSPKGIVSDRAGNVYVTGECRLDFLPYTHYIATIKYSTDGTQQWVSIWDGPSGGIDAAIGIAIVQDSLVVVGGTTRDYDGLAHCLTIAHNSSSGEQVWDNILPLDCTGMFCGDETVAITATSRSDIVIAATRYRSDGIGGADYDMASIAYSHTGELLWTDLVHQEPNALEWPECMTAQGSGAVVAGRFVNALRNYSCRTLIYLADGRRLFVEDHDRPGHVNNGPTALVVDAAGDVIVAGATAQTGESDFAMLLLKYSGQCCAGQTGDLDLSGRIDLTDLSQLISRLVDGYQGIICAGEANIDATGGVDLSDLSILISYLTVGQPFPTDCP